MSENIDDILAAIKTEREYQKRMWGNHTDDTLNNPFNWVSYIGSYSTSWMAGTFPPFEPEQVDAFRKAMLKSAALCVAAIESVDRQREVNSRAFYETEGETK